METRKPNDPFAALKIRDICYFIASIASAGLANRAMVVVIGYQIYQITKSPLALGWMGLVEAIPAISLSLFGGYVADHHDRRSILLITKVVSALCAVFLSFLSLHLTSANIVWIYVTIFAAGLARGFSDPAHTAFEAQVVPKKLTVNAASWIGSTWITSSIIGPALVGFSYDLLGVPKTYLILALFFLLSWISIFRIAKKPFVKPAPKEPLFKSIEIGLRFVFKEQALIGSMSLDLFAVFFGGAIALLPIFATDILHVGPRGFGLLNAAPSLGALLIMLWSTRHPPIRNAGANLLFCVTGFGISMIVFASSKNFILSLLALIFSGIFDGISMVIRRSIVRLLSPEHLRGRVASVSWIFIGASNELGAFESGIAAHWLGTIPAVWLGGMVTLFVVSITYIFAPKLRSLHLDPQEIGPNKNNLY